MKMTPARFGLALLLLVVAMALGIAAASLIGPRVAILALLPAAAVAAVLLTAGLARRGRHSGTHADIHDVRGASDAQAWLAAVVGNSNDIIISKTLEGRILSWNAAAERTFGYSESEIVGKSINTIVPEELRDEEKSILESLSRGRKIEHYQTVRVTKDGCRRDIALTVSPVHDSKGRVVGASKVARDVTERKLAEQLLRVSEQRFVLFMQHLPGLAWIKDLDGRYVYVNDALEQAYDLPRGRVCGSTDEDLLGAAMADELGRLDREALASDSGIQSIQELRQPGGLAQHSLVSRFAIPAPDGAPMFVGGIAVDISEQRRAEEALRIADRRKDEFLAVLGHELRNPLAPLRTGLELVREASTDPAFVRVHSMMDRQLAHLLRLVDDLLDVSRISQGKLELKNETVELGAVVNAAVEQVEHEINAYEHEFNISRSSDPVMVCGDAERLTQVVSNILKNAAKYTAPGGQIDLAVSIEGDRARVRVRDTGYGIPQDELVSLFDAFNQVSAHRRKTGGGGLGVGLALSKRIVDAHKGTLEAFSEGLDKGSTFELHLPLATESATAGEAIESVEAVNGTGRILVVDDNVDAADSMRMLLESRGYSTRVEYDSASALAAAASFNPRLALLDIGLPDMDGYELARKIRALPGGPAMQLCAVTGWGQDSDRQLALEAGFDHHVTKPIDPENLFAIARAADPPASTGQAD